MYTIPMTQKYIHEYTLLSHRFHAVNDKMTKEDWNKNYPDQPFTIGEIMNQITSGLEFLPQVIKDIKRHKGFPNIPRFITQIAHFFFGGFYGRTIPPVEVTTRFDTAHTNLIATLTKLKESDWKKSAVFYNQTKTIATVLDAFLTSSNQNLSTIEKIH